MNEVKIDGSDGGNEQGCSAIATRHWANEEHYRSLINGVDVGITLIDLDCNIVSANRKQAEIVGKPAESLVGGKCFREYEGLDNICPNCPGQLALSSGRPAECERSGLRPDGSPFVVRIKASPLFDQSGHPQGFTEAVEDLTEQRLADEAVRGSQAKLKAALGSMSDAVFISDLEGQFVEFNDAFAIFHRFPDKQHCLKTSAEYPDLFEVYLENGDLAPLDQWAVPRALRGETASNVEYRLLRKDTGETWFGSYSFGPIRDECGNIVGSVVVGRDVTDRKRSEETLRTSEQRLLLALHGARGGVWDWDLRNGLAWWSEEMYELWGVVPGTPMRLDNTFSLILEQDHERVQSAVSEAIARHSDYHCEFRVRHAVLGIRWMASHGRAMYDDHGHAVRLIGISMDITERKRAEEREACLLRRLEGMNQLREDLLLPESPEDKFKRITEAAVRLLDLDFCRIWVVRPPDLCDQGCVHAPGDECRKRDRCLHLMSSSGRYTHIDGDHRRVPIGAQKIGRIASGADRDFLCNNVTEDPNIRDREWARSLGLTSFVGYRLTDEHDAPAGVLAMFSRHTVSPEDDVFMRNLAETTSKVIRDSRVQENLREKTRLALQASQAKSEFLANMSHELRTPMTSILGFADLLQMPELTSVEQGEFVDGIRRNGALLLQLISDILDLSKIEAGALTVDLSPCCPRQVVDDVVAMLTARAQHKGISLQVEYDSTTPGMMRTDPIRLRQILVNLIGNAIKFTDHGRVQVRLHDDCGQGRRKVVFAVSDTGVGIPEGRIPDLFRPFSQVDASATRRHGGTGLGLALVKRLTNALGGEITVRSKLGVGSEFTLMIDVEPMCESAEAVFRTENPQMSRSDPSPEGPLAGRLLFVEDNPEVRLVMRKLIRSASLDVDFAENGEIGCQRAEQSLAEGRPYNLIFMDIQMPVLNGLDATRRLRRNGWTGPIVALTAHAMSGDSTKCIEAGCNDYLAKPLSNRTLQSVLQRFCPGNARSDAPAGVS